MTEIMNWIMDSIRAYGAWSVFAGVIIESVIVPIPSPLIIMGAGFILISADLKFFEALTPILCKSFYPAPSRRHLALTSAMPSVTTAASQWSIAGSGF